MKKMQEDWDKIGKCMLGDFYMTSQESEKIQRKLDSGELENVCCGNGYHPDISIGYAIPMKWK